MNNQNRTLQRILYCATFALLAMPTLAAGPASGKKMKPYRNLVFILIDDLGAIDLGCTGSTYYKTPHIDALAKRGMRFTQAYTASGVCSPTRASIVTGRYPQRTRITSFIPGPAHQPYAKLITPPIAQTLAKSEIGYASFLKKEGIRSLHVGKWHLGSRMPKAMGFDASFDNHKTYRKDDPWSVNEFTDRICTFIRKSGDNRFLAVLSHHTVHVPLHEKAANINRWRNIKPGKNGQNNPTMAAMVETMDKSVGRVLETLKETGRDKDTAIVFFSDNGGLPRWLPPKAKDIVVATSNKPLRGGKSQLYEGGIRVPMIIAAPGLTDRGSTCDVPVISNDLAPTFLSLLGAKPQPKQHLDGVDLSPLLQGKPIAPRNLFWYYPHYQARPPHAAVRSGDWKLVHQYETGANELYHLPTDIGEKNDLAMKLPETTEILLELLKAHLAHLKAPLPRPNPKYDAKRMHESVKRKPTGRTPKIVTTPDASIQTTLIVELRKRNSKELPIILNGPKHQ